MNLILVSFGAIFAFVGAAFCYVGWKRRERYQMVTETETTVIQEIKHEGTIELEGTVAQPVSKDGDFDAPISQDPETVLAGWRVEEWDERGQSNEWRTLATGIYSEPFVLEDATGSVQVAIGNHIDQGGGLLDIGRAFTDTMTVDGVSCEFEEFPYMEVGAESETPEHIRSFVAGESGFPEQSGSITNVVDVGNAHGDRRYYEETLCIDDSVTVLGNASAEDGATRPLHPEDMTVEPRDGDPFVITDQSETALAERLENYRLRLFGGVVVFLIALAVVAAGAIGVL